MHSQFTHALQHVGDFVRRAFSGLDHRDAVIGVAHCLVKTADLGSHFVADGQAGSVVGSGVDALASGQLFHGLAQRTVVHGQGVLCNQGFGVGVDNGHGLTP